MEEKIEVVRVEIAKLDVKDGDTLVVRTNQDTGEMVKFFQKVLKNISARYVTVVVLDTDTTFEILSSKKPNE